MPATIAIVGRPNVGKSTLFNRLTRRNTAITHDRPGVTRDRIHGRGEFGGRAAALVDTGGMEPDLPESTELSRAIMAQAEAALSEAQAILLVMDGREGATPLDERVAERVRRGGKPVLLAVNKVDGAELEHTLLADFHRLGFPMVAVSASHGFNVEGLREAIADELLAKLPDDEPEPEPVAEPEEEGEKPLKLAVLGKPNAGKSSLINSLIGETRLIVSPVAGTTRDAVDVSFERDGREFTIVDTAGVRRKARIDDSLERFSVGKALGSARRCDVVVFVLDGTEPLSSQDKKLLDFLTEEKLPFLTVVNKMDLIPEGKRKEVRDYFKQVLRLTPHVPILHTSAKSGQGIKRILAVAARIKQECSIRVGTGELNRAMREVLDRHQPPLVNRKRAKFYYLTQAESEPPTFVFFVNDTERVKVSYQRYLEKQLRGLFGIESAPIRLNFRSSHADKD